MTTSFHSPKNPYRVQINYDKPLDFGHVESFTTDTLEVAVSHAKDIFASRNGKGGNATVQIFHNDAIYPSFDWQRVDKFTLHPHGGARPGAGRKALPTDQLRAVLSCRVSPETLETLKARAAGKGCSVGELLDEMVKDK